MNGLGMELNEECLVRLSERLGCSLLRSHSAFILDSVEPHGRRNGSPVTTLKEAVRRLR